MAFLPKPNDDFLEQEKAAFLRALEGKDSEFRLYRQDPGAWASLEARLPGLLMDTCGGSFPLQADGFIRGYPFYFRFEEGEASIRMGAWGSDAYPYGWEEAQWSGSYQVGRGNQASLSPEEFEEAFVGCVKNLKAAPMLWKFLGREACWNEATETFVSGGHEIYSCLHYSPEEARERLHSIVRELSEGDASGETKKWESWWKAIALPLLPLNSDEREIGAPPNFLAEH